MRLLLFFLFSVTAIIADTRIQGWCQQGNQTITVLGYQSSSSTPVQRSYPGCSISVYVTGQVGVLATIYADNNRTPLSNPFVAQGAAGQYYFYAANIPGRYDVQISGGGVPASFTIADNLAFDPVSPTFLYNNNNIAWASQYAGADCGAQINAAYTGLPASGGTIMMDSSCSFSTPIVLATLGKPAILSGIGPGATTLTYTATSGTAITLNWGNGSGTAILLMGQGLRNLTLSGPGNSTSTIGLMIGGSQGAQGVLIDSFKIQSFGTNVQFGNNEWIVDLRQGMIRDGGTNVLIPSGLTNATENIRFDHVTFADAPAPYTNSVWVQTGEIVFRDCSFDQTQLRIGNGGASAAQVVVSGAWFENPNSTGSTWYDYLVVDNNNGNYLRLTDSYMLQDLLSAGTIPEFMTWSGGQVFMTGFGMFSPSGSPVNNLIVLANAVQPVILGVNELSGNVSHLFGGSTTGYVFQLPLANVGTGLSTQPPNIVIGPGRYDVGGSTFDVTGNVRAAYLASQPNGTTGVLVGQIPTGTPPLSLQSTTPVPNLFASQTAYTNTGVQITNAQHTVIGTVTLSGGSASVTFSGGAVWTSNSSFRCAVTDRSQAAAVGYVINSNSQITIVGAGSDNVDYVCTGY